MTGSVNYLHAVIDRVDERTARQRQRLIPGDRREIMRAILDARQAVTHADAEEVYRICFWIERKVRDSRMWVVARWLSKGNDVRHPKITAWFLTCKRLREQELRHA